MAGDSVEGFCPDCNRVSSLLVRAEASATAPRQLFDQLDFDEDGLHLARYSVAFCPKCQGVFLHVVATSEPSDIPYEALLYPSPDHRSMPGLPASVRQALESARSCLETGNLVPCVVMCRKCLEAMCLALGFRKGSLRERLIKLRDAGRIEARLYEWADELRLVGNDAAHDFEREISKTDAVDTLDFLEAVLLYVFVLDQRLREFRRRRTTSVRT